MVFKAAFSAKNDLPELMESLKPADLPKTNNDNSDFETGVPDQTYVPDTYYIDIEGFTSSQLEELLRNQSPGSEIVKPESER